MSNSTNHMLTKMQSNSANKAMAEQPEVEVGQSELQPAMVVTPVPKSPMDELVAKCLPQKDSFNLTPNK